MIRANSTLAGAFEGSSTTGVSAEIPLNPFLKEVPLFEGSASTIMRSRVPRKAHEEIRVMPIK
jgi:hypothetical protein